MRFCSKEQPKVDSLKVGSKVLVRIYPQEMHTGELIVGEIVSLGPRGFLHLVKFDHLYCDGEVKRSDDELILVPKGATEDQIEALLGLCRDQIR